MRRGARGARPPLRRWPRGRRQSGAAFGRTPCQRTRSNACPTAARRHSSPDHPRGAGVRPPNKSFPAIDERASAPGIPEAQFVQEAMPFGVVTRSARGNYVGRRIVAASSDWHYMVGTQSEGTPEVVHRISDVAEVHSEQRPEEPVPDHRECAIPTVPAVSFPDLDPHGGADGRALPGRSRCMTVLLVAPPTLRSRSVPVLSTCLKVDGDESSRAPNVSPASSASAMATSCDVAA